MMQIYTGNGKGKTTAALGLCLRALGAGKKICLIQFLKAKKPGSSELRALAKFNKQIDVHCYGRPVLLNKNNITRQDRKLAQQGWARAQKSIVSGQYDLVVLDEINVALKFALLDRQAVLSFLQEQPNSQTEIILTGRWADKKIAALADLVTEMKQIKHYYHQGVKARKGIEL